MTRFTAVSHTVRITLPTSMGDQDVEILLPRLEEALETGFAEVERLLAQIPQAQLEIGQ